MAAVQRLALWAALLVLLVPTAARPHIAIRNAANEDAVPLRGNFSTLPTSVQLITTTISDGFSTAVASTSNMAGPSSEEGSDDVAGKRLDNHNGPTTIRTITIHYSSSTSSGSAGLVALPSTTPLTSPPMPSGNTTREPPAFLTETPLPSLEPPGTEIQRPLPPEISLPHTTEPCTPLAPWEPFTVWSVVYTSTITLNGSLEDYTAPFPSLHVPTYCDNPTTTDDFGFPTTSANFQPPETTMSHTLQSPTQSTDIATTSRAEFFPTVEHPSAMPGPSKVAPSSGGANGGRPVITGGGLGNIADPDNPDLDDEDDDGFGGDDQKHPPQRTTVTFITTEKNPSLVMPTTGPPSFSQSWHQGDGPAGDNGHHNRPFGGDALHVQPPPMFTVTAARSQVIINGQTFTSLEPDQSSTVTVDQGTFTIGPSAVIGHGQTVRKPPPQQTGAASTQAPLQDVNVIGGQALTAIGQTIMAIHSTTYTYGPGINGETVVVDDDTIHVGPSGISVNGMTLGGPAVATGVTKYAIVGGATITEIQPSLVIIEGQTITVAPDMARTTTVVNGQTITIGPDGVTYSSMTIPMADAAITTTFQPSLTWNNEFPEKTNGPESTRGRGSTGDEDVRDSDGGRSGNTDDDDDDDDTGAFARPDFAILFLATGIAIGVWELF